jgi:drug/metabolite transporter (DMT)-like permease
MGFLFIVLGTLMWSLDTLIRYPLLAVVSADTMVFIEHLFLFAYFLPLLFINKFDFKKIDGAAFIGFFVIGMIGSAASTLAFTKAFSLINPSLVILLQKLQPFIAILLSSLMLKERIHKTFYVCALPAFLGAFLLSYKDIAPVFTGSLEAGVTLGYVLTLVAVIGWGASTVFGKNLSTRGFAEPEIMAGRFIFGFVLLSSYCAVQGSLPTAEINLEVYIKILIMVIISGLIGMYFYYKGLKTLPAHVAAVAELFFPLSAVTINWIFLGKTLDALQIAGAVLLVGSSLLLQKLNKSVTQ